MEGVFDYHETGTYLSETIFYISILWSLKSICLGLFSTYLMEKEYSVGDTGKILKLLSYFLGTFVRICAIVMYFAPFLGILNIMLPYSIDQETKYSESVRQEIGASILDEMSQQVWYTGATRHSALLLFLAFPIIHVFGLFLFKGFSNFQGNFFWNCRDDDYGDILYTFYKRTLHGLNTLLVPELWTDWDQKWYKSLQRHFYKPQWESAKREYRWLVVAYCIENLILSLPTLYTCIKLVTRSNYVTPLDVEVHVHNAAYAVLFLSPALICLIAICQYKLFVFYNLNNHPWSRLLVEPPKNNGENSSSGMDDTKAKDQALTSRNKANDNDRLIVVPHLVL